MLEKVVIIVCFFGFCKSHYSQPLTARILNGWETSPGEMPYRISMQWNIPPFSSSTHFCAGAILNEQWILTHAECTKFIKKYKNIRSLIVKAGKHDLGEFEESEQSSAIDEVYMHEHYLFDSDEKRQDVGLIKLKTRLKFNERVTSVKLPENDSELIGNVSLSGWGSVTNKKLFPNYPTALQATSATVLPRQDCMEILTVVALEQRKTIEEIVSESDFCTKQLNHGASACGGDFGGPITRIDENNDVQLVGIAKWGTIPCKRRDLPLIFVRTSFFRDWINDTINGNDSTMQMNRVP